MYYFYIKEYGEKLHLKILGKYQPENRIIEILRISRNSPAFSQYDFKHRAIWLFNGLVRFTLESETDIIHHSDDYLFEADSIKRVGETIFSDNVEIHTSEELDSLNLMFELT